MKAGEFDPSLLKADCTIDFSGNLASMGATVDALRIGGTAVWVGGVCPQEPIRLDTEKIVRNLYTIKGLHNYNADDFRTAVSFMESIMLIIRYRNLYTMALRSIRLKKHSGMP